QCTSSTTTPTAHRAATAPSSSATAENSRSRCHPPPRTPGPLSPCPSRGTSRPTSARTYPGTTPSAPSTNAPPSTAASSPSAPATGNNGSCSASGKQPPHTPTTPLLAAR